MEWNIEKRLHVYAIGDGKGPICYVDVAPVFYDGEPCGNLTSRGRSAEELEAIANLIAAAPVLLRAVKIAREVFNSRLDVEHCLAGPLDWRGLMAAMDTAIEASEAAQ